MSQEGEKPHLFNIDGHIKNVVRCMLSSTLSNSYPVHHMLMHL